MKVINICSNYGSYKDGIGAYSKKIVEAIQKEMPDIEITTLSTDITNLNKFERVISLAMSKNIMQAYKKIKKEKINVVNIEYPFTEWNPLIIIPYVILARKCNKKNTKLVVSLHEYDRVNPLRKKIIKFIVKRAHTILVTEEKIKEQLSSIKSNIYIRDIPSNIPITQEVDLNCKDINQYVFFGLVNKSKAFEEMIEGWKSFQKENNNCKLIIITSSEIEIEDIEKYNICIKRNLSDKEIEEIMIKTGYCILPIKPDISFNNATLKTASLFSCIPIGKFNDNLRKRYKFLVNMREYTVEEFYKTLLETRNDFNIKQKQREAKEFGEKYNIQKVAQKIICSYLEK